MAVTDDIAVQSAAADVVSAGFKLTVGSTIVTPQLNVDNLFDHMYLLKGAFFSGASGKCDAHELHCSLPLEPAVAATGEPDASHSALANLRDQSVGTKCLARESCGVW